MKFLKALALLGLPSLVLAGPSTPPAGNYIRNVSTNAANPAFRVSSGSVTSTFYLPYVNSGECVQAVAGGLLAGTGSACGSGGGGGGGSTNGSIVASTQNNVGFYSAVATNTINGSNNFTWNGSTLNVTADINLRSSTGTLMTLGTPSTLHGILGDGGGILYLTTQGNDLGLGTNGNVSDLYLDSSHHVGIGGAAPAEYLDVQTGNVRIRSLSNTVLAVNATGVIISTTVAASGNFINNSSTLQSGATFYVSSGTANTYFATNGTTNLNTGVNINQTNTGSVASQLNFTQKSTGTAGLIEQLWYGSGASNYPLEIHNTLNDGSFSHFTNTYVDPDYGFIIVGSTNSKKVLSVGQSLGTYSFAISSMSEILLGGSAGSSGQFLKSNGTGSAPTWATASGSGDAVLASTQVWTGGNTYQSSSTFNGAVLLSSSVNVNGSGGLGVTYGVSVGSITLTGGGNAQITENGLTGQIVLSTGVPTNGQLTVFGASMTVVATGLTNTILAVDGSGVVISTTVSGGGVSLSSTNTWTGGNTFTSSTTFTGNVLFTQVSSMVITNNGAAQYVLAVGTSTTGTYAMTVSTTPNAVQVAQLIDSGSMTVQGANGLGVTYGVSAGSITFSGGGTIKFFISGSTTAATTAISSGTCASTMTITATGVTSSDVVNASFNGSVIGTTGYIPPNQLTVIPWPSSNAVNFNICNDTNASITPGAVTINWQVIH